ncbi:hypothetical protein BU16DRAFT_558204 [Lophium mytilinum]|uniref:Uncharacterized protein n=1 Tax=Lophium mytilinum TaxID=390894 RepID=A0A6A6R557_9PEZI|nr:hypothetical protein BU16DRAFT_558204 [Lophium mytilinum]
MHGEAKEILARDTLFIAGCMQCMIRHYDQAVKDKLDLMKGFLTTEENGVRNFRSGTLLWEGACAKNHRRPQKIIKAWVEASMDAQWKGRKRYTIISILPEIDWTPPYFKWLSAKSREAFIDCLGVLSKDPVTVWTVECNVPLDCFKDYIGDPEILCKDVMRMSQQHGIQVNITKGCACRFDHYWGS